MNSRILTFAMMLAVGITSLSVMAMPAQAIDSYPSIPVSISGTISYTPDGITMRKASFASKPFIALLNASTAAIASIQLVTGKDKIPPGSQLVFNPANQSLAITNKDGFNFPLNGPQGGGYSYGYIDIDRETLYGAYNNISGKETDVTGYLIYLTDDNGFQVSVFSEGSMNWIYGPIHSGSRKATLSVKASGSGYNSYGEEGGEDNSVVTSFFLSGSGSADESTDNVPFYSTY